MSRISNMLITAAAVTLAAGLSTPSLGQDATYRVVARTGQFAQGGGFYSSFGTPRISHNGRVAFKARVVGVLNNGGVWSEGVAGMNNLQAVARQGDAVAGLPGTFLGPIEFDSGDLIMNASGETAFWAPITGTQAQFGDGAILVHAAGGVAPVGVPGQLVSLPCGGFGCQRWLTGVSAFMAFNAAGQVAFVSTIAGTAVNADNDELVVLADGSGRQVVLREGDLPPSTFGVVFSGMSINIPHLNDNGEILMRLYLRDLNIPTSYWSVWRGAPGGLSLVAAQNWTAPVGGTFQNAFFGLGEMSFNNAGSGLFMQSVINNQGDSNTGLWLGGDDPLQAICFEGLPAPGGFAYDYPESFTGAINTDGDMAFVAYITGPGVNFNNNVVIVRRLANAHSAIVVRENDPAPGFLPGVVFSSLAFFTPAILNDDRIVFRALLSGPGIHAGNNQTLWITRDGAPPALLMRTGQTMVLGGQLRTVESFTTLHGTGPESGRPTGVSQLGQVALRVTFTDASQAIIVASPTSACPGDVNGDGVVNFTDLNALLGVFGHAGDVIDADLDLDGDVDFADLNQVLSNFGIDCAD